MRSKRSARKSSCINLQMSFSLLEDHVRLKWRALSACRIINLSPCCSWCYIRCQKSSWFLLPTHDSSIEGNDVEEDRRRGLITPGCHHFAISLFHVGIIIVFQITQWCYLFVISLFRVGIINDHFVNILSFTLLFPLLVTLSQDGFKRFWLI